MEKFLSLSFYQKKIKYITVETNNNCWLLLNHGIISLPENRTNKKTLQWAKDYKSLFKKNRFTKNNGYITVEPHHTYLNKRIINTLEKIKYQDVIQHNYKNILPILFEKNHYGLDYNVAFIESNKTTEISFMGMLQEKIDYFYEACLHMDVNPLALNPSYQYFAIFLRKQTSILEKKEYLLYVESSNELLTFVVIHNNNPIMKRSIEINDHLEIETNNYFYYLKHYLMMPDPFIIFSKIDQHIEFLVLKVVKFYYDISSQKVQELLRKLPCFSEMNNEIMIDYQDCFVALGGLVFDESI